MSSYAALAARKRYGNPAAAPAAAAPHSASQSSYQPQSQPQRWQPQQQPQPYRRQQPQQPQERPPSPPAASQLGRRRRPCRSTSGPGHRTLDGTKADLLPQLSQLLVDEGASTVQVLDDDCRLLSHSPSSVCAKHGY
jgi:hypothetical protein